MKRWHALSPNWAITLLLILILTLHPICAYYEWSPVMHTMLLAIIPVLLLLYFQKHKIMANVFFIIFILYFLGIIFNVFNHFSLSSKLSESSFLGAYLLLIFVMMGKLKEVKFEGLVSGYMTVVFLVSAYLMFLLYNVLIDSFQDPVIFTLTVSKGVVLLVMAILAFAIYLSHESTQSILFLTMVCCFVFSDILSFISTYYLYFWLYEGVQYIFQSIGLILFCIYVFNFQKLANGLEGKRVLTPGSPIKHISIQS